MSAVAVISPSREQFEAGVRANSEAYAHAKLCKVRALDAARHWRHSKALSRYGEFEQLCESWKLSKRSINLTIEFLELAEQSVRSKDPTLKGEALDRTVNDAVLRSPKPLTALLREWKLVENVGAYDPAAYQARQLAGPPQLTFAFETVVENLDALVSTPISLAPSSLQTLEEKLETALQRVRALRAQQEENTQDHERSATGEPLADAPVGVELER